MPSTPAPYGSLPVRVTAGGGAVPLEGPGGEDLALEASEAAEKARDLLARRMRSALWITLCSSALLLAADVVLHGDSLRELAPPKLALLVANVTALLALQRVRDVATLRLIAIAVTAILYAATGVASMVLHDPTRAGFLFTVIAMSTCFLPWGASAQLATLLVGWAAFLASAAASSGGALPLYAGVAFAVANMASLYASRELDRSRAEQRRAQQAEVARRQAVEEARIAATLARVGREINASLKTAAIVERLASMACDAVAADAGVVLLEDEARPQAAVLVAASAAGRREQRDPGAALVAPLGMAAAREILGREDVATIGAEEIARLLPPAATPVRASSGLCVALRPAAAVVGVLVLIDRAGRVASPGQRMVAHGIGRIAATALANARLIEQLERASRLKSEFVSTVSHELRTPLNVIVGNAEMLDDPSLAWEERKTSVSVIRRASRELLEMVENTLDVGRLEAARSDVRIEPVSLATLWEDLRRSCLELPRRPGVDLQWIGPETSNVVVAVDRRKVATVMRNLVGNALKFTERGTVRAEAMLSGPGLELRVADTGIGIPQDRQGEIFEMFRQIDGSDSRAHGGAGLGLYIVRSFVDELGGAIAVESAPGRGSTFTVSFPARAPSGARGSRPGADSSIL